MHIFLRWGYTDMRCLVAAATKFCTDAPNICGPSFCNMLHVTLLVPRILRWLLDFWTVCTLVSKSPVNSCSVSAGNLYILIVVLCNQLQ
jgi:hypothetical protein